MAVASPEQIRDSKAARGLSPDSSVGVSRRDGGLRLSRRDFPVTILSISHRKSDEQGRCVDHPNADRRYRGAEYNRFSLRRISDSSFICPAPDHGRASGWSGTMQNDSTLRTLLLARVVALAPGSSVPHHSDRDRLRTRKTFTALTPDNEDWLPDTSQIDYQVTGAARSGSKSSGWPVSAARIDTGGQQNVVPQPHIERQSGRR